MGVTVHPLSNVLGAEIRGVDLAERLDDGTIREIHDAWMEHLVLLIRGQTIDDPQLVAFSSRFGELDGAPIGATPSGKVSTREYNEITVISNVVENGRPIGGLGKRRVRLAYGHELLRGAASRVDALFPGDPVRGGRYELLQHVPRLRDPAGPREDPRAGSEGHPRRDAHFGGRSPPRIRVGHRCDEDARRAASDPSHASCDRADGAVPGSARHAYVPGLSVEESEALLDTLWGRATAPENTWTHTWRIGDLVMWDNRCAMHRRDGFDDSVRRIMHRTQLKGDRPYYAPPEAAPTAA